MQSLVRPLAGLTLLGLVPLAVPAQEGAISNEATVNMARNCFACHGPNGRSPGTIPSINRLSAERMTDLMKGFKSGDEPSTVMGRHAKGYSEAEIEAIARYIASVNKR